MKNQYRATYLWSINMRPHQGKTYECRKVKRQEDNFVLSAFTLLYARCKIKKKTLSSGNSRGLGSGNLRWLRSGNLRGRVSQLKGGDCRNLRGRVSQLYVPSPPTSPSSEASII